MTSSNGNICPVTGPFWGESTSHRWIPLTKVSDMRLNQRLSRQSRRRQFVMPSRSSWRHLNETQCCGYKKTNLTKTKGSLGCRLPDLSRIYFAQSLQRDFCFPNIIEVIRNLNQYWHSWWLYIRLFHKRATNHTHNVFNQQPWWIQRTNLQDLLNKPDQYCMAGLRMYKNIIHSKFAKVHSHLTERQRLLLRFNVNFVPM